MTRRRSSTERVEAEQERAAVTAMARSAPPGWRAGFSRNLALGPLFELFLVSAVASMLMIRGLLALSGFPQMGGSGLHIAHMLWGGLLMLASLLALLGFIGRRVLFVAAFLAGVGFGTFIDELGKFVTSDNNYFFQPAVAIVYVIFVLLFLVSRGLESRRHFSDEELLANAFDIVRDTLIRRRRPAQVGTVLAYLRRSSEGDDLLLALRETLERTAAEQPLLPPSVRRARRALNRFYLRLVDAPGLDRVIAAIFVGYVVFLVLTVGVGLYAYLAPGPRPPLGKGGIAFIGLFLSNGLSLVLILVALWRLRASRLAALIWFDRAVVVDVLLGQVFAFYLLQFGALLGVALDVVVLVLLQGAIETLRHLERHGRGEHALAQERLSM